MGNIRAFMGCIPFSTWESQSCVINLLQVLCTCSPAIWFVIPSLACCITLHRRELQVWNLKVYKFVGAQYQIIYKIHSNWEFHNKSIASALQFCRLICYCTLGTLHCSAARVSFWFLFKYSSWSLQRTHWNCTDAESLFAFDFAMADLTVLENINIDFCWNEIWFSSKCGNFEAKRVSPMKV